MSSNEAENDLPEDALRQMVADSRRLLKLTEGERGALFRSLKDFSPSTAAIDPDEADELAGAAGVDRAAVESAVRLASVLHNKARVGTLRGSEIAGVLGQALSNLKIVGADTLLSELKPVAAAIRKSFERVRKLERTMPTLGNAVVDCDLRYLAGEEAGELGFAPMAIVRLELEGVDDAIFHCTPRALRRLIKTFQEAATILDTLEEKARQKA